MNKNILIPVLYLYVYITYPATLSKYTKFNIIFYQLVELFSSSGQKKKRKKKRNKSMQASAVKLC